MRTFDVIVSFGFRRRVTGDKVVPAIARAKRDLLKQLKIAGLVDDDLVECRVTDINERDEHGRMISGDPDNPIAGKPRPKRRRR